MRQQLTSNKALVIRYLGFGDETNTRRMKNLCRKRGCSVGAYICFAGLTIEAAYTSMKTTQECYYL